MLSIGAMYALLSAAVWGSGDFAGGVAARRGHPLQVLALSALSGAAMLAALAFAIERSVPGSGLSWAVAAGIGTAVGIASLYRGLAIGSAAVVAPVAAVVTAALPAAFAIAVSGAPDGRQLIGFAVALAGIWLVTRSQGARAPSPEELKLAISAGVGFGLFLILIARAGEGQVFVPLAVSRGATVLMALAMLWRVKLQLPSPVSNPAALLAGLLDAGGNVFYVMALQHTRIDVAAVVSSLYPAATVVLARAIHRQPVSRVQWLGIVVCLAAVVLIAS